MSSVNKAILIGHVGKDPEINTLQAGGKVAKFSLATSQRYKDKDGERQERTNWHNIVVFNENLIAVVEGYVRKGSKLYVEGSIETRAWEKNGEKRYMTEIVLRQFRGSITLLDKQEGGGRSAPDPDSYGQAKPRAGTNAMDNMRRQAAGDLDDDIPF